MQHFLVRWVLDSFVEPRTTMRLVLDRVKGLDDVALIFGLSAVLNALVYILTMLIGGQAGEAQLLFGALIQILFLTISYVVLVFIVTGIGKLFGGQGDAKDVAAALAWNSLVTVVFAPILGFVGPTPDQMSGAGVMVMTAVAVVTLWLFFNFIAEAHRFPSALRVAGVTFALVLAPVLLVSMAAAGPM